MKYCKNELVCCLHEHETDTLEREMQEDTQKECGDVLLFSVSSPANYTLFSNLNQSYNT